MSKFEQQDEFFSMTQQLFKYIIETGTKKLKDIAGADNNHNSVEEKKYNKSEGTNAAKYLDKYYELKEEVSSQESPMSTQKNNVKIERVPLDIDFSEKNILQAVVYSEIFGKPKAKRRRR